MRNERFYTDVNAKIFIAPAKESKIRAAIKGMYDLSSLCVDDAWLDEGRMNVSDSWLEYDEETGCFEGEFHVFARLRHDTNPYTFEEELIYRVTREGIIVLKVESDYERDYYINDREDYGMYDY